MANNPFNPTRDRGAGHVPALRWHASAAPLRGDLTQALGTMKFACDPLQDLIKLLDLPDSDYWADVGSCEARTMLNRGGESLLRKISNDLISWPRLRQEHLAYILGESSAALEIELLTLLESSMDPDAALAAREALAGTGLVPDNSFKPKPLRGSA